MSGKLATHLVGRVLEFPQSVRYWILGNQPESYSPASRAFPDVRWKHHWRDEFRTAIIRVRNCPLSRTDHSPCSPSPKSLICYILIGRHPATCTPRCFLSTDKRPDGSATLNARSPQTLHVRSVHRCPFLHFCTFEYFSSSARQLTVDNILELQRFGLVVRSKVRYPRDLCTIK